MIGNSHKAIDFKTKRYCKELVVFNAYVIIVFSFVPWALGLPWITYFTILFCIAIITTHWRLHIDLNSREYREYVRLFGIKIGQLEKFSEIEYIFIKTNSVMETLRGEYSTSRLERTAFDAYLKFNENNKILIVRQNGKSRLKKKLKPIASYLNVKIVDYSVSVDSK